MDKLTALVTFIAALSVASERLVEIVKGLIPWLNQAKTDETTEGWRRSILQAMAVVSGIISALFAVNYIPEGTLPKEVGQTWAILGLGLLASGGSGFWNSILTYLGKVKDVKKSEAEDKKVDVAAKKAALVGGGS